MCVLYRNPNCWTDLDEIWHIGGPREQESSWGGVDPVPPIPQVQGVREASVASAVRFGKNFLKQKFQGTPNLVGWVTFSALGGPGPDVLLESL